MRQLRNQAKDLLRSIKAGQTPIEGASTTDIKLADTQLIVARRNGYASWAKLLDAVETPVLIERFKGAVNDGEARTLALLLKTSRALRNQINAPIFSYDAPAIVRASSHPKALDLLPILLRFGADPNIRSKWWAGSFSALDTARPEAVELLLDSGAKFDVWSASNHGRIDILRALLDKDPASVNARGGDGETPLHFAANAEVAELLIERGADLEIRDIDHEATPIQYQVNNLDVVRVLLKHGAKPDIFSAVVLDDVELARQILADNSDAANARVGSAPFVTTKSEGGHIYTYRLGGGKTPMHLAAERGSHQVLAEIQKYLSPIRRLILAAWTENEPEISKIVEDFPGVVSNMGEDAGAMVHAAKVGRVSTVRLLMEAGFDPLFESDMGTALHAACWFGHVDVVKLLVDRVPLDLKDSVHGSPPLGWACHGAQWCRNSAGDYVGVVETLLMAGADPNQAANYKGISMIEQAGSREDVKAVLRRYGPVSP